MHVLRVVIVSAVIACSRPTFVMEEGGTDAGHEAGACCPLSTYGMCCVEGGGWVPDAEFPGDGCPIVGTCGYAYTVSYDGYGCANVTLHLDQLEDSGAEASTDATKE